MTALLALSLPAMLAGCNSEPPAPAVDCSTPGSAGKEAYDAAKEAGRTEGSAAADAKLTFAFGRNETYGSAYQSSLSATYNSSEGQARYNASYNVGLGKGITDGSNDVNVCEQGMVDGGRKGQDEGVAQGYHDSYQDGYVDGYNKGFMNGPWVPQGAQDSLQACRTQGRDACYNEGFNARQAQIKADSNSEYSKGRAAGQTEGTNQGRADALAKADTDGYNAGYVEGRYRGETALYKQCYNYAYANGYRDANGQLVIGSDGNYVAVGKIYAYNSVYFDATFGYGVDPTPSLGYTSGTSGRGDGFYDGVNDYHYTQGGALYMSRYGFGSQANIYNASLALEQNPYADISAYLQFWAYYDRSQANPMVLDAFTATTSQYMTQQEAASLAQTIDQWRAYNRSEGQQSVTVGQKDARFKATQAKRVKAPSLLVAKKQYAKKITVRK